jgi:hypothetical protein
MRAQASLQKLPLAAALLCVALAAQAAPDRGTAGTASELLQGMAPPAGAYDARFCVTVGAAPASCGPATAELGGTGQTLVRISDIAYRLQVHADQMGVTLFHGTMQIDGFFATYRWSGNSLQFVDPEKRTRYELTLGTRRFDAQ